MLAIRILGPVKLHPHTGTGGYRIIRLAVTDIRLLVSRLELFGKSLVID